MELYKWYIFNYLIDGEPIRGVFLNLMDLYCFVIENYVFESWTLEDNEYFCFSSCFEDETKLISSRWTEIGLFQCDFFFSFNREQQENNVHLKTIDCDNRVLQWNVFGKFGFGWVTNKCQNIAINHSFAVLLLKYWTGTLCWIRRLSKSIQLYNIQNKYFNK